MELIYDLRGPIRISISGRKDWLMSTIIIRLLLTILSFDRNSYYYILPNHTGMIESTQLRNIQNIENSLSLLRSKIEKLTQLDSQKEETLSKLILSTVPVVEKKIREHNSYQQL